MTRFTHSLTRSLSKIFFCYSFSILKLYVSFTSAKNKSSFMCETFVTIKIGSFKICSPLFFSLFFSRPIHIWKSVYDIHVLLCLCMPCICLCCSVFVFCGFFAYFFLFRRRLLIFSLDVNYLNRTHRPQVSTGIYLIHTYIENVHIKRHITYLLLSSSFFLFTLPTFVLIID